MSKNKKITRKAFILKASKVACGYILLPITVSSLSNCDAIVKSEDCNSLDIYSECPCHGARFNIEGEVIIIFDDEEAINYVRHLWITDLLYFLKIYLVIWGVNEHININQ